MPIFVSFIIFIFLHRHIVDYMSVELGREVRERDRSDYQYDDENEDEYETTNPRGIRGGHMGVDSAHLLPRSWL